MNWKEIKATIAEYLPLAIAIAALIVSIVK